jgi:hypothetical protein
VLPISGLDWQHSMLLARRGVSSKHILYRMQRSVVCQAGSTGRTRVAVVGDVHDQWSAKDAAALKALDTVSNTRVDNNDCQHAATAAPSAPHALLLLLLLLCAAAAPACVSAAGLHAVCWRLWQRKCVSSTRYSKHRCAESRHFGEKWCLPNLLQHS